MKRNIITIVMVSLMALTVVSGAGILRANASPTFAEALDCQQLGWKFNFGTNEGSSIATYDGDATAVNQNFLRLATVPVVTTHCAVELRVLSVTGPGIFTFSWRFNTDPAAGQYAGMARLYVDDYSTPVATAPVDATSWHEVSYNVPAGTHDLFWRLDQKDDPTLIQAATLDIDNVKWQLGVTKASVLQDLATLKATVNGMPNSAFYSGTKVALLAVIDAATLQAKYSRYGAAAYMLQSKFIPRVDGCALRMTPDTTDLARTCPAQAPLYEQATSLMQDLQWLQANPP